MHIVHSIAIYTAFVSASKFNNFLSILFMIILSSLYMCRLNYEASLRRAFIVDPGRKEKLEI